MMQKTPPASLQECQSELVDLGNELLDEFYSEVPQANAYGTGYEANGERESVWYLGREHGSDGAVSGEGIDYWYRKYRDMRAERGRAQEEKEYVYGKYGWMDFSQLVNERDRLRQLFESAVEDGYLDEDALDQFEETYDSLETRLRTWRSDFNLHDVAGLFESHDSDTLMNLLAHGDEESRVVWSLLFSKDEDGKIIENSMEVPIISEQNAMMFVRAERVYVEYDERNEYPYGAVIGYDDTPERFFVHRIESDPDLRDPETEWTLPLLKEKMGFDAHLWEVDEHEIPHKTIIRVQGDLALVRHDYTDVLQQRYEENLVAKRDEIATEHSEAFFEARPKYDEHDALTTAARQSFYRLRVNKRVVDGTKDLKELQDDLNIDEETVRDRMREDWQKLTAKRRRILIDEILFDRLVQWAIEQSETSVDALKSEAKEKTRAEFGDTHQQVNAVHGNHTVVLGPATEHPDRWGDSDTLAAYVVPAETEALGYILHDEHQDKELTLAPGVYEFRFLNGYEDQWWM